MFFNTRKYGRDVEKNHKKDLSDEPSMWVMTYTALMASCPLTRPFLRMHKKHISDHVTVENVPDDLEQVPLIYFHGFRGGAYTTRKMVRQALKDKKNDSFLQVTVDLRGNFKLRGTWTGDRHPVVQVVFRERFVGIYAIDYYLSFLLPFLAKRYHFKTYTAISHSLTCPCIIRTELKYARDKKFPHLDKCAFIAGPFDGVTYLGDIPNVNVLNEKGRPSMMNPHYLYLLMRKNRVNPNLSVLNIFGNVLDDTNTDKYISVVSARSIRYILAPKTHLYREIEIRGKEAAEHSNMHDDPFVINIINRFIGLRD